MASLFRKPGPVFAPSDPCPIPSLKALLAGQATVCETDLARAQASSLSWTLGYCRLRDDGRHRAWSRSLPQLDCYLPVVNSTDQAVFFVEDALSHFSLAPARLSLGLLGAPLERVLETVAAVHPMLNGPRLVLVVGSAQLGTLCERLAERPDFPRVGLCLQRMAELDSVVEAIEQAARGSVPLGFYTSRPLSQPGRIGFLNAMVACLMARKLRLNTAEIQRLCRLSALRFEDAGIGFEDHFLELAAVEDLADFTLGFEFHPDLERVFSLLE